MIHYENIVLGRVYISVSLSISLGPCCMRYSSLIHKGSLKIFNHAITENNDSGKKL